MKKYSTKKMNGGVAVLQDGKVLYITDAKTARADVRKFNKTAQQSVEPTQKDSGAKWKASIADYFGDY